MISKFIPKLLSLVIVSIFAFQSCSDNESTPADVLVTSHRQTGVVYKVDKSSGALTKIFVPKLAGDTLRELRAFVYHSGENVFYASASTETYSDNTQSGRLYSINPSTKVATVINENAGIWYAINNWAVTEDDSLISIGYFRTESVYGYTSGVLKFGTDGEPAAKLVGAPEICCGNGMLYDKGTGTLLVASGDNTGDAEIIIETIVDGEITLSTSITTLTDFPDDLTASWCVIKAMAKDKKGNIFAIFYDYDRGKSHLVKVDLEGEEITHISTLGIDEENQFNTLAFIPAKYAK